MLDYLVGVALILAPNLFGFADGPDAAVWTPRVLGVGLIVYSLITGYEYSLAKVVSMKTHLMIDVIASLFLAASPFIFGFYTEELMVWLPHVAVGITVIIVVLLSETEPSEPMKTMY